MFANFSRKVFRSHGIHYGKILTRDHKTTTILIPTKCFSFFKNVIYKPILYMVSNIGSLLTLFMCVLLFSHIHT